MVAFLLCAVLPCEAAQLNLMPWPSHITRQQGFLALDYPPRIELTGGDERVHRALQRFLQELSIRTGAPFDRPFAGTPNGPLLVIHCAGEGGRVQSLEEDESYHLTVSQAGIELTAANPLGIMHGLQTLLQLVEPRPIGWVFPGVRIDDAPRFAWRGLMIDVSRHFMLLDALERNIDGMAAQVERPTLDARPRRLNF
jgi:hexosaminidase